MLKIFASIGAIQIVTILSSLIRTKYIAISLGPEGTGIIGIIDQVVQLTSFISALSLPLASIKFLSKANSESVEAFKKTYVSFLGLLLTVSITASFFLFLLVSSPIEFPIGEISQYRQYLYIALLGMPAMMLGGFLSNVLASAEKPNSAAFLSLIYSLSLTIAVLIGITLAGITGFYWATVISGFIVTVSVLSYIRLKLHLPFFMPNQHPFVMLKQQPEIVQYMIYLFIATVTHSFSLFAVRYLMLHNQGEAAAGLLHALLAIALSINMVLAPINGFFLTPKMNRNISNLEKIQFSIDFQKIQVLCMTVIVLPFVLFPTLTILILFSDEFTVIAPYLFTFVLAQFIAQMGGVYQSLMIGFDNTRMFSIITVSCWLSFAVLSWLTIPTWGFWGIAISFLASKVLLLIWSLAFLKANYPIKIPVKVMLLAAYCISLIVVIGYYASGFDDLSWTVFTVKSLIYIATITGMIVFLSSTEKRTLILVTNRIPLLNRLIKVLI